MKVRLLAIAGGVAGLGALGMIPAHAAGPNGGNCTANSAPSPSGQQVPIPDPQGGPSGTAWIDTTGGSGGIEGSHGFLAGSGSTGGISISGYQTESGLNGYANVGSSPSACIGVAGAGGVSAP